MECRKEPGHRDCAETPSVPETAAGVLPPADPPRAGPLAGTPSGETGAPPCNTAPDTCIGGHPFRVLRCGVDSLYLSYRGRLSEAWEKRLRALKLTAQSPEAAEAAQAQVKIGEHLFEVLDKGSRHFAYVLIDNWFRLEISGRDAERLPLAHVKFPSELLTLYPLVEVEKAARFVVATLGRVEGSAIVSRIDLCVDVATGFPMNSWPIEAWVTRAHRIDPHYVQGRFSGWSIGSGGSIVCRLYDKTLELQRKPREYLTALWRETGWDGSTPVWRLEFQFRRAPLKELGINSPEDLPAVLAALWRYAMTEWLRLTEPSVGDQSRSRWPTHPLWEAFASVAWGTISTPLKRVRIERIPHDEVLFQQGLGALSSFMASHQVADIPEGIRQFMEAAQRHYDRSPNGKTFRLYVLEKLLVKGRRFNTRLNVRDDPEQRAREAEAYRRAKDGE